MNQAESRVAKGIHNCRVIRFAIVAGLVSVAADRAVWAGSKQDLAAANRQVRDVLRAEAESTANQFDRRQVSQSVLETTPDHRPARWQAGYVAGRKTWLELVKSTVNEADRARVAEYRQRRATAPPTFSGQVTLAGWCRSKQLMEQGRAHLFAALLKSAPPRTGNDLEAKKKVYEQLGHRRIGPYGPYIWVSPEDFSEVERQLRDQQAGFERWSSRVKALADKLAGTETVRTKALETLRSFTDPRAAVVMERLLCWHNSDTATAAVGVLAQLKSVEATRALASQSLFSPWKPVRDRATEALTSRRKEDFVPELMAVLYSPVQFELQILGASRWGVLRNYQWSRESHHQHELARLGVAYLPLQPVGQFDPNGRRNGANNLARHAEYVARRVHEEQRLNDLLLSRERQVDQLNDFTESMNQQVGTVLSQVSGVDWSADPTKWWDWWCSYLGFMCVEEKPTQIVEDRRIWTSPPPEPMASCLVAGTPVWTDHGCLPIEQITVGDRVLAKNVETGELAYKPVLHTTVRPPSPTFSFTVGDDTITSSVGHNWWVSGAGWTKTRELHDSQPIHTATGMIRLSKVDTAAEEKTYNLVVADFHTYFVGQSRILSHDVLPPRPTNRLVPGLVDE